jgi:hypothetical protein
MKKIKYLLILMLFPFVLNAQDKDYSKELGYVDFGDLTEFQKEDNLTEIFLEENLLKMVSKMSKEDGDEMSSLLGNLKLVKVNAFQIDEKNQARVQSKINDIDKMLVSKKWDRIVRSKQKGEIANVYIKQDANNRIAGLVVTTIQDKGEVALVNIVGQIDLEQIGQLGTKFNIPSLDDVKKDKK